MIARLAGTVVERAADHVVVDVGGVGYRVFVSSATLGEVPAVGEPCVLRIHTLVREDAFHLFGFVDEVERELFRTLLKLSGIGPKNAMHILSGLPVRDLVRAIAAGDVERLIQVPGIGRRTAERMVVELKDRIGEIRGGESEPDEPRGRGQGRVAEVIEALTRLGVPRPRAERAIREVAARLPDGAPLESMIRESLREIGST